MLRSGAISVLNGTLGPGSRDWRTPRHWTRSGRRSAVGPRSAPKLQLSAYFKLVFWNRKRVFRRGIGVAGWSCSVVDAVAVHVPLLVASYCVHVALTGRGPGVSEKNVSSPGLAVPWIPGADTVMSSVGAPDTRTR